MKYVSAILFFAITGCHSSIQYPEGGYPYPKIIVPLDLHQYHYPIKDIVSQRDSFRNSYMYLFYTQYNEPNISLKPQSLEMFRLTYTESMGGEVIVTLTKSGINVKKGAIGWMYFNHDDSLLSDIERKHFRFLEWRFPIDMAGKDSVKKKFIQTELKKYPHFLDLFYYKMLFEKSLTSYDSGYFGGGSGYEEYTVSLSQNKFYDWVEELNVSGYWKLPNHLESWADNATDGSGFYLEANIHDRYNYVGKRAGSDTSRFDIVCQHLLNLAGLRNDKKVYITNVGKKD